MSPDDLVRAIVAASNAMRRCERKHGDDAESAWACAMDDDAVRGLDETQFFWFFPLNKVVRVDFSHLDALPVEPWSSVLSSKRRGGDNYDTSANQEENRMDDDSQSED